MVTFDVNEFLLSMKDVLVSYFAGGHILELIPIALGVLIPTYIYVIQPYMHKKVKVYLSEGVEIVFNNKFLGGIFVTFVTILLVSACLYVMGVDYLLTEHPLNAFLSTAMLSVMIIQYMNNKIVLNAIPKAVMNQLFKRRLKIGSKL